MKRVGKYHIREHIASGGMAEIYRGSLEGPHGFVKEVVIKALHPRLLNDERYVRRFLREAKLWARLNHSNIVQVYEFFEEGGRYYIIMEYIKGVDLLKVLRRGREKGMPPGIPRTVKILQDLLSALDCAHNYRDEAEQIFGIIHRDISPQNILISINGDVKITDFGIAKVPLSSGLTAYGTIAGKIDYMSPEQALGREVDFTTDIFSAGIILWEMLTDNKLFFADTDIELLEKVRRAEVVSPSLINPLIDKRLEGITMKALQRERRLRYQKASEFASELARYLIEYPHNVSDENLSEYMKSLFPEFLQECWHKTEILDEREKENDKKGRGIRTGIIPLMLFLSTLTITIFGILLFTRSQNRLIADMDIYKGDLVNSQVTGSVNDSPDHVGNTDLPVEDILSQMSLEESNRLIEEKYSQKDSGAVKGNIHRSEKRSVATLSGNGRLSVNAIPWADIYIGKKRIGRTPIFNYELKSGTVEIIFKNDAIGIQRKKRIMIIPGVENKFTEDLTK